MTEQTPTAFDTKNLPFKKRLILAIAPIFIAALLRLLFATNRKVYIGIEHWDALLEQKQPFLIPVWHENAPVLLPQFGQNNIHALVSQSYDGEVTTRLLARFGVDTMRGSSSKGGRQALEEMIKKAPHIQALGLAIDGPRGPRRKAKSGIAVISQHTGLPIVPIASISTRSIRVRSWDRMCIPKPFGTCIFAVGKPIAPTSDTGADAVREKTREVELALNTLQEDIEAQYGIDAQLG